MVDDVEVRRRPAVHRDDPAVLELEPRFRVVRAVHRHEPQLRVRGDQQLLAERLLPRAGAEALETDRGPLIARREQAALPVDREGLADERRRQRRGVLALEPLRPALELLRARAARPERRVDLEQRPPTGRAQARPRARGWRPAPAGRRRAPPQPGAAASPAWRAVLAVELARAERVERQLVEAAARRRGDEVGAAGPERIVGRAVELHGRMVVRGACSGRTFITTPWPTATSTTSRDASRSSPAAPRGSVRRRRRGSGRAARRPPSSTSTPPAPTPTWRSPATSPARPTWTAPSSGSSRSSAASTSSSAARASAATRSARWTCATRSGTACSRSTRAASSTPTAPQSAPWSRTATGASSTSPPSRARRETPWPPPTRPRRRR